MRDPNGGLLSGQLAAWVAQQVDYPVEHAVTLPDLPDRVAVLSRTGGPGLRYDDTFDAQVYQVQVRGASGAPGRLDYDDAERMAWQLDAALLGAHMPTIGGVPTLGFNRSGGPPTPDEDAGNRPVMTCNYVVTAASAL